MTQAEEYEAALSELEEAMTRMALMVECLRRLGRDLCPQAENDGIRYDTFPGRKSKE